MMTPNSDFPTGMLSCYIIQADLMSSNTIFHAKTWVQILFHLWELVMCLTNKALQINFIPQIFFFVITILNLALRGLTGQVLATWIKSSQQAPLCVTFQKLVDYLHTSIYLYPVCQTVKMYGQNKREFGLLS